MERIQGQQLWPMLFHGPEADQPRLLTLFCDLLVRLHLLDWRPFAQGPPRKYRLRDSLAGDALVAVVFDQYPAPLSPTLDWLSVRQAGVQNPSPGPVHWDFHPANVMLSLDGSACVIDWTQIDISDTRFDLAWTLLLIGSIESEIWRIRVLRDYERLLGRPVEDLDFFEVAAGVKRLYSSYLSISIGAENLGMRPGAEQIMMENAPKLHAAYRMMFSYTRLGSETDTLLASDRHHVVRQPP
jgi:aminoglycoside phosphotransferase (APT) family kinase protein